jgi:hypothetical protein
MERTSIKGINLDSLEKEFKPDLDATLIRVIMYVFVLNVPFLGVYKNVVIGNLDSEQAPFLIVGIILFLISLYFSHRFFQIRFGWNEEGVFKQGVFKYTHIRWGEIIKIYETGAAQEWTESDMLFIRKRGKGKKLFMIKSKDKKIAFEFYTTMVGFKKSIANKLNLGIGDDYNAFWDFIVNG